MNCSPSLPLQQAKKLDDAVWKVVNHGKDKVIVSIVLSSSVNDSECVTKRFVVKSQETYAREREASWRQF